MSTTEGKQAQDSLPIGDDNGGRNDRTGPPPTRSGVSLDIATSALIKSLRRGQGRAVASRGWSSSTRATTPLIAGGVLISCCEDHGLAEPDLPQRVMALYQLYQTLTDEEGRHGTGILRLPLLQATLAIARARKSRVVDNCLIWAYGQPAPLPEIGPEVYDKHTYEGKRRGAGWKEFWEQGSLLLDFTTGELTTAPKIADPYRSRAIKVTTGRRR